MKHTCFSALAPLPARPTKKLYLLAAFLIVNSAGFAQYTQNFDTLVNTAPTSTSTFTTLPEGWGIYEVGSGAAADGRYAVGTGSSNTGNAYSFGNASGNPERALGTIASNTNFPTMGAIFFNETDTAVTSVTIVYTGEQWRYGGRTTGTRDTLVFEYSLDATGIVNNVGTWIRVSTLDFLSIVITPSGTAGTVLDGNAPANRQTLSYTITGLAIQPGESIVFRWSDFNISGNDDGLAIDNFSLSAGFAPGVMSSGGTTTGGGTGGGGGTVTNTSTSTPIFQHKVATDSAFLHLYGNLHGHSTHSDGRASTMQPIDDYTYAKQAQGMDFLGISEHNHSTAGLQIADYKTGSAQADAANGQLNVAGQPFIALHGMEWGTIAGGGHVLVYGFKDSLINWESGNYDILVNKSDYTTLFDKVRNEPGAFATLAHPNTGDYTGLTGGYKGVADSAVASVAIENGPSTSSGTSYTNYPASLGYINYYRNLLKQGYRVGAHMDQDNHEMTFGTVNGNRMVVLAKERTREALVNGIKAMRIYASNDYNARVSFTLNNYIMGSSILSSDNGTVVVNHADGDGETVSVIQLYGGKVRGADATLLHSSIATTSFVTNQPENETWYYYAIVTQADGNKIITSPIWLTRASAIPLPIKVVEFKGFLSNDKVFLSWKTASEINAAYFIVERSADGITFQQKGTVKAQGSGSSYSFIDNTPLEGVNYYRLKQVDADGKIDYSTTISVRREKESLLIVTPNPTKGEVTIRTNTPATEKLMVQLIDAAGNMVYNKTHSGGALIYLNVGLFANGIYVLRVNDEITQLVINK